MMSASLILCCVIIAYFIGIMALHGYLLRSLRTRHEERWIALGKPSLILNNSISNGFAVQRFLWQRQYLDLEDEHITRLCRFVLIGQIGWAFLIGVLLIVGPVRHA